MAARELRPTMLAECPHPVAAICEVASHTREAPSSQQPSSPDEWVEPVWVVDNEQQKDVLEVAVNLSHIERQMGPASARTVKVSRRTWGLATQPCVCMPRPCINTACT